MYATLTISPTIWRMLALKVVLPSEIIAVTSTRDVWYFSSADREQFSRHPFTGLNTLSATSRLISVWVHTLKCTSSLRNSRWDDEPLKETMTFPLPSVVASADTREQFATRETELEVKHNAHCNQTAAVDTRVQRRMYHIAGLFRAVKFWCF